MYGAQLIDSNIPYTTFAIPISAPNRWPRLHLPAVGQDEAAEDHCY
jgi:hypothetical protein